MPTQDKPNYLWSIFTMKCPRCRTGHMFSQPNPWKLRQTMKMPEQCPVCGQHFRLEVGFWYGTGYVSYALSFLMSVLSFFTWWLLIGISTEDHRFFFWLGLNAFLLVVMQPWLMRLSRVVYLYFFVYYDPAYKQTPIKNFDYESNSYYKKDGTTEGGEPGAGE